MGKGTVSHICHKNVKYNFWYQCFLQHDPLTQLRVVDDRLFMGIFCCLSFVRPLPMDPETIRICHCPSQTNDTGKGNHLWKLMVLSIKRIVNFCVCTFLWLFTHIKTLNPLSSNDLSGCWDFGIKFKLLWSSTTLSFVGVVAAVLPEMYAAQTKTCKQ